MACRYCFYLEKAELFPQTKIHRMSLKTLKQTVKQVMRQGEDQISFGWQGGEPTLMGREFFERAFNYQRIFARPGQKVSNGFQTNGILIDGDWARLFKEYNVLVGLSLDGPMEIHDRYRLLRGNKPSWDRIMKARDTLLDRGVEVNALSVVTNYSVRFPERIYNFHKENGLNFMQFIPCVETDPLDNTRAADYTVDPDAFGDFLCSIFDLWISDFKDGRPTTSIRYFESVLATYLGMNPGQCTLMKECGVYLVIEHNGDVYSCDFFVEPKWKLGNVSEGRLSDMLNSDRQNTFGKIKGELPTQCLTCPWLKHCRGGCPKDRIFSTASPPMNYLSPAYKKFLKHADPAFKKLAGEWMQSKNQTTRN